MGAREQCIEVAPGRPEEAPPRLPTAGATVPHTQPSWHRLHASAPAAGWYQPAPQLRQLVAPGEGLNEPAGQGPSQSAAKEAAIPYEPARQGPEQRELALPPPP